MAKKSRSPGGVRSRKSNAARPQNWRRKLSAPIGRFRALADVRDFILEEWPAGPPKNWHLIGMLALEASEGGDLEELEGYLRLMAAHGGKAASRYRYP